MHKVYNLAYFVSHPIQYQTPFLKLLANEEGIKLKVFFLCDHGVQNYQDKDFNVDFKWDMNLLEGYDYQFLNSIKSAILENQWDAVWFHGYINKALLYGMWACKNAGIPFFFRAESNLICTSRGFLKDRLIRWIVKNAAGLLWVSTVNKEYYLSYGASKDKLFFTPYAVDNSYFQSFEPSIRSHNKTIILFASKFTQRKNATLLLNAYLLAKEDFSLNESELWFIGDGEDKSALEKILKENPSDDVKLLGFKNQTELPEYFSQCDVFVLPSEKEPFGLVINEVMNFAKPIITTNEVGAAKDLVKDGENGWVVEAGCLNSLARVLKRIIAGQHNLKSMGNKSLEIINGWSYSEDIAGIKSALKSLNPIS